MSVQEQAAEIALTLSESDARFLLEFLSRIAPHSTEQVLGRDFRHTPDFDSYGKATDRGQHVETYMEEVRGNDRV